MPKHGDISGPLPLPVGFALLPSLLPGRQLTPLLYVELNQLPVYLVISPSHEPHLSLLPVLLTLELKSQLDPLSVLLKYEIGKSFNPTLDGVAPWADLWVPLGIARQILHDVGAGRLFWSKDGRGLLGDVDDAVSWEEDGGWSHNWLPAKSHLPVSSYSLDNLLSSKWPLVEIIPKQRCIHTPAGAQRLARLSSEGLYDDPSRMRKKPWSSMWDGLLDWTGRAYSQYQAAPSRPSPGPTSREGLTSMDPVMAVINSIPSLLNPEYDPKRHVRLVTSDISRLLPASIDVASASSLFMQIVSIIWELWLRVIPGANELRTMTIGPGAKDLEQTKLLARVNLGLCSLAWDIVIGIWRMRRLNERLQRALKEGGQALPANVVLGRSSSRSSTPDGSKNERLSGGSESEADEIEALERRRGGSPDRQTPRVKSRSRRKRNKHSSSGTDAATPPRITPSKPRPVHQTSQSVAKSSGHPDRVTPKQDTVVQNAPETDSRAGHDSAGEATITHLERLTVTPQQRSPRRRGNANDLDRPDVTHFANSVVNPVIFGILAAIVYVWWRRDPPEPSVVVL